MIAVRFGAPVGEPARRRQVRYRLSRGAGRRRRGGRSGHFGAGRRAGGGHDDRDDRGDNDQRGDQGIRQKPAQLPHVPNTPPYARSIGSRQDLHGRAGGPGPRAGRGGLCRERADRAARRRSQLEGRDGARRLVRIAPAFIRRIREQQIDGTTVILRGLTRAPGHFANYTTWTFETDGQLITHVTFAWRPAN